MEGNCKGVQPLIVHIIWGFSVIAHTTRDISFAVKPDIIGIAGANMNGLFCLPQLHSKEGEHCISNNPMKHLETFKSR